MLTGYKKLDKIWEPLEEGQLVIVAARPARGKTSFMINLGNRFANIGKVLYVDFENSKFQLEKRFGLPKITIVDNNKISIEEIRTILISNNFKYLMIDYIQLFTNDYKNTLQQLKQIAIELKVCIIVSSQLTREIETRPLSEQRPVIQDLKDTFRNDEQYDMLDKIVFLYREVDATPNELEIITYIRIKNAYETAVLRFSDDMVELYE